MTQGSDYSALTRIEDSFCVGDVLIASTAVIGPRVVLRADPGCSITIREGACLGPDVLIHAFAGSIEIHQGVCLASGVLIFGAGQLGQQVCVGADSTLINPCFSEGTIISSSSLWGDSSRPIVTDAAQPDQDQGAEDKPPPEAATPKPSPPEEENLGTSHSSSVSSRSRVIGRQQFELMVAKMFPDRDAFKQSQR